MLIAPPPFFSPDRRPSRSSGTANSVDGKRKLKWFASETDAREYATVQNRDRDDYGSKITLIAEQRFTLIKAEEIASRHPGATVLEGMRHYDAH
jgi:hypothetical protein